MKRIVIRRRAEADTEAARSWYETEAELGELFIVELRRTLFSLRSMPERFPEVRPLFNSELQQSIDSLGSSRLTHRLQLKPQTLNRQVYPGRAGWGSGQI